MNTRRLALLAVLMLAPASAAVAAPCAGFNDVDSASGFCDNVEWIKNRKVTLGCTSPAEYCPDQLVSRLQMAAFMNRLGTAMTPIVIRSELTSGAVDLDASPVVCVTPDQAIADFPRRVLIDASLSGTSPTGADIAVRSVYSTNGGASWTPFAAVQSFAHVPAAQWGQASDVGSVDLDVGQNVRFGIQVGRTGAGGDLSDSRCLLRAQIGSRNGAASPL